MDDYPSEEIDKIKTWTTAEWQSWWSANRPVLMVLDVTYDVKMAIAGSIGKNINDGD